MKRIVCTSSALILLVLLPGCGRLVEWGKGNFYQGEQLPAYRDEVKPYIRSVTIYDQFTTKATFDALWLSDEVRSAYVNLHVARQGKNEERHHALLRRQLEENNHYLSFYVLSLHEVKLADPASAWSLFLCVNEQYYQPIEIKEVELPYEYQIFFGALWSRFKVPYLVRFNAQDANNRSLITSQTEEIALYMRSAYKEHAFMWNLHPVVSLQTVQPTASPAEKLQKQSRAQKRKKRHHQLKERTPRKKRKGKRA